MIQFQYINISHEYVLKLLYNINFSIPIVHIFSIVYDHPDSQEGKSTFNCKLLHFIRDLKNLKRLQFICRVCYLVPKVTKAHNYKLVPSLHPLILITSVCASLEKLFGVIFSQLELRVAHMKMTLQAVTRLNIHDFKHVIAWHWLSPGSLSVTMHC